jgi:hypothetical protein
VDYRFWVADGRPADFEVVFGPDGIWRELLARGEGYIASDVECESASERRFRVKDFWVRHFAFELFRERFAAEFERFERLVFADGLIERQQFIGAYYEEDSDGDDLVPS